MLKSAGVPSPPPRTVSSKLVCRIALRSAYAVDNTFDQGRASRTATRITKPQGRGAGRARGEPRVTSLQPACWKVGNGPFLVPFGAALALDLDDARMERPWPGRPGDAPGASC